MSIDFTKPVYSYDNQDCRTFTNDLEAAIKGAAQRAKTDSDGDDYFVMQAIKRVATPRPDVTVTNMPTTA